MSVQPRITRIATTWPGNFVADDLVIPCVGAADTPLSAVLGTLKQDVVACTYAGNSITVTFAPQTLQTGVTVVPSLELGTAAALEVAVDAIDLTAQTLAIRFRTMAGGTSTPPSVGTGARLVLAIFRPLPYR